MTFQLCRPATIKLLPYGGAPFGGGSAAFALQNKNKKTTASIEAVVYGGDRPTKSEPKKSSTSLSVIVCVPC